MRFAPLKVFITTGLICHAFLLLADNNSTAAKKVHVTVIDKKSGRLLDSAQVIVVNRVTGESRTLYTDKAGYCFFVSGADTLYRLDVWRYEVECRNTYMRVYADVNTSRSLGPDDVYSRIELARGSNCCMPFRMENLYWDAGSSALRPDALMELKKLIAVMRDNPGTKFEISSHTDCKGTEKSNLLMSQKRGEAVLSHLRANGISEKRVTLKWYGASKPVNNCGQKCSDEELQENRRTEFKILML